ncbi:MAG: Orotate phosphoribosyltransferase [Promethearchaeota archaeon]|nr:MAG: Orotate phosphoribosyltransferase [Candidatus Lokiarchaeota archaeon]
MGQDYSYKHDFNQFIINNSVIGFFETPIQLKSGRLSYFYVNWRNVVSDVFLIDQLTDYLINFIEEKKFEVDCFIGVPEGATKIGIITQFKWAKNQNDFKKKAYPLPMARGKIKQHGDPEDRAYIGPPKGNIVVIEDVTTTGQSLLELLTQLNELNVTCIATISLTSRNELRGDGTTIKTILAQKGIKYYAMSNALELLPLLSKKIDLDLSLREKIERYFEMYGERPLKL